MGMGKSNYSGKKEYGCYWTAKPIQPCWCTKGYEGLMKVINNHQDYPDDFKIVVADASAYKQFGNSVAVPAIQATAEQILKTLDKYGIIRK